MSHPEADFGKRILGRQAAQTQRAESGGGVLEEGQCEPHSHKLRGLGRLYTLPAGFGAESRPPNVFPRILSILRTASISPTL